MALGTPTKAERPGNSNSHQRKLSLLHFRTNFLYFKFLKGRNFDFKIGTKMCQEKSVVY